MPIWQWWQEAQVLYFNTYSVHANMPAVAVTGSEFDVMSQFAHLYKFLHTMAAVEMFFFNFLVRDIIL